MPAQRGWFIGVAVVAALAFWVLLAGPRELFGIDTGNVGVAVLVTVAWLSMHRVSRMPDGGLGEAMAPGEWRAWIGLAFTLVVGIYASVHAPVFQGPPLMHNPDAGRIGRNIVLLLVAWAILTQVLGSRWRSLVQEDERDRAIEAAASHAARIALSVFAIGIAMLLGFSPPDHLAWAPPPLIAHLLVIGLVASCMVEYGYIALAYWRGRR